MKKILLIIILIGTTIYGQVYLNNNPYRTSMVNKVDSLAIFKNINIWGGKTIGWSGVPYLRVDNGQLQHWNGSWKAIPDSLSSTSGWTRTGSGKLFPTTTGDKLHIRTAAGDTTGTDLLNNYGRTTLKGIVTLDSGYILNNGIGTGGDVGGYQFDGVNDYISVADNDNLDFGTGDFSIEVNIKCTLPIGAKWLISKGGASAGIPGYNVYINSSGALSFAISDGSTTVTNTISATNYLITGKQYHIVCVADRDDKSYIYLNGVLVKTTTISSANLSINNSLVFNINNYGNGNDYLGGNTHQVRLYNRALTSTEVLQLYNNGRPDLYQLPYANRGASQTKVSDYDTSKVNDTSAVTSYKRIYYLKGSSDSLKVISNGVLGTAYTTSSEISMAGDDSVVVYGDLTGSNITYIGCVAEYLPQNAGSLGWVESSGNQLSGVTSGSPICLNKENRPMQYRDIYKGIANNTTTTLTNVIPRGYVLKEVRVKSTGNLDSLKLGTSAGGTEIISQGAITGTSAVLVPLVSTYINAYNETADLTLYVRQRNSSTFTTDLIFKMEKVGN